MADSYNLSIPKLIGSGFKVYKKLISETLYAIVWIGHFNPLGDTWNSAELTQNSKLETSYGTLTGNR